MSNRRDLNVQHVTEYEDLLNIHVQSTIRISFVSVTVRLLTSFNWCSFQFKRTNCVRTRCVLIFGILETSQIVTPFNPLWSHNVAHNCDHGTFNVDRYYDILQHLLRICMSSKATVKFQAIHRLTSSTCRDILRLVTRKLNTHCMQM
jgi:hypothetical protein